MRFFRRQNRRLRSGPHPAWATLGRAGRSFARLLYLGGIALCACAALAITGWIAQKIYHARALSVHAIEVRGLQRTNREQALQQAGLHMHAPILALQLDDAVRQLEAMPWVRQASVRRQLPDRLQVDILEHHAKLAVMLKELWFVNDDGEPFKRFAASDALVLPMVTGLLSAPPSEKPLAEQKALVARLQEAIFLLEAMVQVRDDLYNVEELHFDADLGWSSTLLLGRSQSEKHVQRPSTSVHLGHRPIEALPVMLATLAQLAETRRVPEAIWAANEHQAGRVQVRLAAPLPTGKAGPGNIPLRTLPAEKSQSVRGRRTMGVKRLH